MPRIVDRQRQLIEQAAQRTEEAVQPLDIAQTPGAAQSLQSYQEGRTPGFQLVGADTPPPIRRQSQYAQSLSPRPNAPAAGGGSLPPQSPLNRLRQAQRQLTAARRINETEDDYINRLEESGFDPSEIGDALANQTQTDRPNVSFSYGGEGGQPLSRPEREQRANTIEERLAQQQQERAENLQRRQEILQRRDRILRERFGQQGPSQAERINQAGMVEQPGPDMDTSQFDQTRATAAAQQEQRQNMIASRAIVEGYKASGIISPEMEPFVDAIAESGMPPNQVRLALDGMRLKKEKPDSKYTISEMKSVMPVDIVTGSSNPPEDPAEFKEWVKKATDRLDQIRNQQPATSTRTPTGEQSFRERMGDTPEARPGPPPRGTVTWNADAGVVEIVPEEIAALGMSADEIIREMERRFGKAPEQVKKAIREAVK